MPWLAMFGPFTGTEASLLLIIFACQSVPVSQLEDDSKIVGGFAMTLDKAPFLVSLKGPVTGHYCGGSLLTVTFVLTGCHCVSTMSLGTKKGDLKLSDWTNVLVCAGSENIDLPSRYYQTRGVKDVKIHPECSFDKFMVYDFALMILESAFQLSPTVHPFDVVSMDEKSFDARTRDLIGSESAECYVAGWGVTAPDGRRYSSTLNAVRMQIIPDAACQEKMGVENEKFIDFDFAGNAQMCALSFGYKKNASDCVGDSGGPFFCGNHVFGTISYGYDCGRWDVPNVYSKLSHFVKWYGSIFVEVQRTSIKENTITSSSVPKLHAVLNLIMVLNCFL